MAFSTVPDKAAGDVFTEAMWDTYLRDNFNKGVMRPIAETLLGSATASITFSSISATDFTHLELVWQARGDNAALTLSLWGRFNADAGANYDWQRMGATATAAAGVEGIGVAQMELGLLAGSTGVANSFGGGRILIPSYAGTTAHKTAHGVSGHKAANSTTNVWMMANAGFWRSAAAINSITLLPSAGNFIAGTKMTLYGMPS